MNMMFEEKKAKAQGSLEYLVIIAAVLAISAVVVYFMAGATKSQVSSTNFAKCKKAASACANSHLLSPNDPCINCEKACVINGIDILNGTGVSAVDLCKQGKSDEIYQRKLIVCGDGIVQGDEVCDSDSVDCSTLGDYKSGTEAPCLSNCSGYNTSECIKINHAPVLSDASVTPKYGAIDENYLYKVTYTDVDGDQPSRVELHILNPKGEEVFFFDNLMSCDKGDPVKGLSCSLDHFFGRNSNTGSYSYYFIAGDGHHNIVEYHCKDIPSRAPNCEGPTVTS